MMAEGGYRHLPMVDKARKPTGVVAVHGIVHYLVDHFPETVYNLPPDPKAKSPRAAKEPDEQLPAANTLPADTNEPTIRNEDPPADGCRDLAIFRTIERRLACSRPTHPKTSVRQLRTKDHVPTMSTTAAVARRQFLRSTTPPFASAATRATACSWPARSSPTRRRWLGNDVATFPDFPAEIRARAAR